MSNETKIDTGGQVYPSEWKHPPQRLFTWWVGEILCICCCDCGAVLQGGAK